MHDPDQPNRSKPTLREQWVEKYRLQSHPPSDAQESARLWMKSINSMSLHPEIVAYYLTLDHRTLQQSLARVIWACLQLWSEMYTFGQFDDRNEGTTEWANQVVTMVPPPHLPFI